MNGIRTPCTDPNSGGHPVINISAGGVQCGVESCSADHAGTTGHQNGEMNHGP